MTSKRVKRPDGDITFLSLPSWEYARIATGGSNLALQPPRDGESTVIVHRNSACMLFSVSATHDRRRIERA